MNKKLIIIIGLVVLLAGAGGAAAFFMTRKPAEGDGQTAKKEPPGLIALESFVVNLEGGGKDRFAKLNLQLTVEPAAVAEAVLDDPLLLAKIRDRTLTLIASKTYDELITPLGKESLRREVKARINPLLEDGEVEDVLFSEFMVQ